MDETERYTEQGDQGCPWGEGDGTDISTEWLEVEGGPGVLPKAREGGQGPPPSPSA